MRFTLTVVGVIGAAIIGIVVAPLGNAVTAALLGAIAGTAWIAVLVIEVRSRHSTGKEHKLEG